MSWLPQCSASAAHPAACFCDGLLLALVSVSLMLEYEAVLKRPEHLHAAGIAVEDAEIILDQLAASMTPVDLFSLWRPLLRDGQTTWSWRRR